jgi:hypothetical protein
MKRLPAKPAMAEAYPIPSIQPGAGAHPANLSRSAVATRHRRCGRFSPRNTPRTTTACSAAVLPACADPLVILQSSFGYPSVFGFLFLMINGLAKINRRITEGYLSEGWTRSGREATLPASIRQGIPGRDTLS